MSWLRVIIVLNYEVPHALEVVNINLVIAHIEDKNALLYALLDTLTLERLRHGINIFALDAKTISLLQMCLPDCLGKMITIGTLQKCIVAYRNHAVLHDSQTHSPHVYTLHQMVFTILDNTLMNLSTEFAHTRTITRRDIQRRLQFDKHAHYQASHQELVGLVQFLSKSLCIEARLSRRPIETLARSRLKNHFFSTMHDNATSSPAMTIAGEPFAP